MRKTQKSWNFCRNHEISWNFTKFHETSLNSPFLTIFSVSGGSETLIFLRKNNDLGAGPPKHPLFSKNHEIHQISPNLMILGEKVRKWRKMVIFYVFRDSRVDCTPPGPMILLMITMVWGDRAGRGARKGAFYWFYVKTWEKHENLKTSWFSWIFMKFNENHDFFEKSWFLGIPRPQNLNIP